MNQANLEQRVADKKRALELLIQERRLTSPEIKQLKAEILQLERMLSAKRGEPYADEWSLPGIWEGMTLGRC
ncbi:MAG TPA: hypothetical protein VKZ53_11240 [Candidatus Angelobacter sp.]|nr:hypothetical protein [Candidatus Angelobacter sp.]